MNDSTKITVEICEEQIDAILTETLARHIDWFKHDLELRKSGTGMSIFDQDPAKDCAEIQKYIDAFELVYGYYTV